MTSWIDVHLYTEIFVLRGVFENMFLCPLKREKISLNLMSFEIFYTLQSIKDVFSSVFSRVLGTVVVYEETLLFLRTGKAVAVLAGFDDQPVVKVAGHLQWLLRRRVGLKQVNINGSLPVLSRWPNPRSSDLTL